MTIKHRISVLFSVKFPSLSVGASACYSYELELKAQLGFNVMLIFVWKINQDTLIKKIIRMIYGANETLPKIFSGKVSHKQ